MDNLFKCPQPDLIPANKAKARIALAYPHIKGFEVTYPVSYTYNGTIDFEGKVCHGFEVPPPKVPQGWQLQSLGVGLDLNAYPPRATMFLARIPKAK